ncbi:phosphodiester glycosidase family protein [Paenibacillus sp. PDC88]|uniref:phosphodiester glycosidase family protein n=1 Tax=Paenibacillus sp. PDC88 TaxID=1884375 RepID=UPI0008970831|nr:phosphodiester glycosidase family protein [Paenibacillus sp. PDC88]SDX67506.1 Predicted protein [Paenibacillus sp. PDC88]
MKSFTKMYVKKSAAILLTAACALALPVSSGISYSGIAQAVSRQTTAVILTYPSKSITLSLDKRESIQNKLNMSEKVQVVYASGNKAIARVNQEGVVIPVKQGSTNILIQVVTPGYKGQLKLPVTVTKGASKAKAVYATKKVSVSGRTFSVKTVTLPKGTPVTAGLANQRVGAVNSLSSIASTYNASAAINGTYFEAYGGVPDPYGMIISDGIIEHIGNTGTTIGFKWDGSAVMDTLRVRVRGTVKTAEERAQSWYVYFVNRTPTKGKTSAVMYTPTRGANVGFSYGTAITVRKGIVTKVGPNTNAAIPSDGYVLVFTGKEEDMLATRFKKGSYVDYSISYYNEDNKDINWSNVHTAIGAGPRLVKDGRLAVNPAAEGFSSSKILTDGGARSGIAIKKDGTIVLATVPGATIKQWGNIMLKLGAYQAMNMDGGASSGMYANGKTVTSPGRLISNGLVFGNSLKW